MTCGSSERVDGHLHIETLGSDWNLRGSARMIDYGALKAWNMAPVIREYTVRDSVIYNLGIGGGVIEDANEAPLEDVWEERLMVAPTMASALCVDTSWHTDARTGISADRAVHGDEAVTIHHPLPRSGRICGLTRVEEVYDKGAGRGALLMLAKELTDPDCGFAYATAVFPTDSPGASFNLPPVRRHIRDPC
jgi:hypothetical protein